MLAYVLIEYYRPRPIDWTPTYENDDKIPFGTNVLYSLMPGLMHQPNVQTIRLPVYNFLTETERAGRSNYVLICQRFEADQTDLRELFRYVRQGNNVLISAYELPDSLEKVLGFEATLKDPTKADTTLKQFFQNPRLSRVNGYVFPQDDGRNFLRIKKPQRITVLGRNARREPVFIRVAYGQGQFLIHNLPLAFTNYYVLDPKTGDYAFKALAYLPALPTYWDEYQKQGRFNEEEQSIFRYIRSQPALNWAYYIVLFGLLFYAIFAGKRMQRIIPVLEPPRNTSLDFVNDVGRLYFQQGDHDNLARKKIQYFLADVRDRYNLNTTVLDDEFAKQFARKHGTPIQETLELVRTLRQAQKSISLSEYDLLTVNGVIERFNATVSTT